MNALNIEGTRCLIPINKPALKVNTTKLILIYEWTLCIYFFYLLKSVVNPLSSNLRVVAYSAVFLLFQTLQTTYKYLEIEDPLHLTSITKTVRRLSFLCIFNMICLLFRILIDTHNLHSLMLLIHFFIIITLFTNEINKKSTKIETGADKTSISRVLTPLLLFAFSRTINSNISDVSLIQLGLLTGNLFGTVQIRKILSMKESHFFGWSNYEDNGKTHLSWSRRKALKSIIVGCCILVVFQNLLLIFQSIKYEVSVTVLHTFIISIMAYYLYRVQPNS